MADTIKLLKEIGAFQPGETHAVDETNPFFLREKCERYVTNGLAEWFPPDPPAVDTKVPVKKTKSKTQTKPEGETDAQSNN